MVAPTVLVIGPGARAEEAAREVRDQGCRAVLVCTPPTDVMQGELDDVEVLHGFELVGLDGAVGDLTAVLRNEIEERQVRCATVIAVPGPAARHVPNVPGVLSLHQVHDKGLPEGVNSVAMVLRGPLRPSFARAVEIARQARSRSPPPDVWIFSPEMLAYGMDELSYADAQAAGVRFVRSTATLSIEPLTVQARDSPSGIGVSVRPDLVVVDGDPLAGDGPHNGPQLEASIGHVSMGPAATMREGVLTCSSISGEMLDLELRTRVRAAAARAVTLALRPPQRSAAVVDRDRCSACLTCVRSCPFLAARPGEEGKAIIDAHRCQACGVCVGGCPSRALSLPGDANLALEVSTEEGER